MTREDRIRVVQAIIEEFSDNITGFDVAHIILSISYSLFEGDEIMTSQMLMFCAEAALTQIPEVIENDE